MAETALEVRKLLSRHTAIDASDLRDDLRLQEDLGMTGSDAEEFIRDFFTQFHLEWDAFSFDRHFGEESIWPWELLLSQRKTPVTVRDLVNSAVARRWVVNQEDGREATG